MSHVRLCLLMRVSTTFDLFLYGSPLMSYSRMVKPLQLQHPEPSFVMSPCHTAHTMSPPFLHGQVAELLAGTETAWGAARDTWLLGSMLAKQLLPQYLTGKSRRTSIRTCRPGMTCWAPGLFMRGSLIQPLCQYVTILMNTAQWNATEWST